MIERRSFDVVIVGAGPAGLAAASVLRESGLGVALVDDNATVGGQIWRGGSSRIAIAAGVTLLAGTVVIGQVEKGVLLAVSGDRTFELGYGKLIIATGARERLLPFPGWTLANVMGAGGLQSLVKGGLPIAGKRVVVAGTGPLLLAVAAYLRERGALVPVIAEQASRGALMRFGAGLARWPLKLMQAVAMRARLTGTRYVDSCWPVAAEGDGRVESVVLSKGGVTWCERCDYLACGFGLAPNVELPLLLGCGLTDGFVEVSEWQETTVSGVYCAGEPTGIGGLDLAIATGRIAAYAVIGREGEARRRKLLRGRARGLAFKNALERAFALREELKSMATPETLVCRCEDVALGRVAAQSSWRSAKLQTRCGMGACQGRVCGPAVEFLLGWRSESVRPPLYPARVDSLMEVER